MQHMKKHGSKNRVHLSGDVSRNHACFSKKEGQYSIGILLRVPSFYTVSPFIYIYLKMERIRL